MRIFKLSEEEYRDRNESGLGMCSLCGADRDGYTEPDVDSYPCDECGENAVCGIEQLLLMGQVEFD